MAKIVDIENKIKQNIKIHLLSIDEIHNGNGVLYEKWKKIDIDLNYSWK